MYGTYDIANLKHGRNLNPGTQITQRMWSVGQESNLNCPKYEIMFIFLKVKLIFLTFKMLPKAMFSNFSDSWTSEIAVSFVKNGIQATLFHSAGWWKSMDHCFGNNAVRNKCVIQSNCSKMCIFKICLNESQLPKLIYLFVLNIIYRLLPALKINHTQ